MQKSGTSFLSIIVGLSFVATAGCGDDGDSGDGGDNQAASEVSTGLPQEKSLDELTEAEAVAGCTSIAEQAAEQFNQEVVVNFFCTTLGLQFATTEDACTQSVEQCVMQPDAVESAAALGLDFGATDCDQTATDLADCSATVGELEQCFGDMLGQLGTALSAVSCGLAGDADAIQASTAGLAAGPPASCASLASVCPGVVGGE